MKKNYLLFLMFYSCCLLFQACSLLKKPNSSKVTKHGTAKTVKIDSLSSKKTNSKELKAFATIIKDKELLYKKQGLFTVYQTNKDKWYFEISDSLLGRDLLLVSRISKSPMNTEKFMDGYGGSLLTNTMIKLERKDQKINLYKPINSLVLDSTKEIYSALKNSSLPSINSSFEIVSKGKSGGYLIDVTDLLSSGIEKSFNGKLPEGIKGFKKENSWVDTVLSFPINTEIRTTETYGNEKSTEGSSTFNINTSIVLLPKNPAKERINDERIGFFGANKVDFGLNSEGIADYQIVNRWQLIPKDTAAYLRGELVAPTKQIVIYIDPATPKKWVQPLIDGVNDWNVAFEAAGFKNAIIGKEAPKASDSSDFDVNDARFSVIRYLASNVANAMGPHINDPRSGEIVETHVQWFHNVMDILYSWYFAQTAASNPEARKAAFSDKQMGQLIRFVSSHEVGHTLGLMHNFGSSAAIPLDSLRSKSYTDTHGTAPSIMDYARFNYVAQPGDGVTHFYAQIGDYDKWAIKWAYTWLPNNKSAMQESVVLKKWMLNNENNPLLKYGRQPNFKNEDPRNQSEDLTDDVIKANTLGIKNLKVIIKNIPSWIGKDGETLEHFNRSYTAIQAQLSLFEGHVSNFVGGVYLNPLYYGSHVTAHQYVDKQKNKEALDFLFKEIYQTPDWLLDKAILKYYDAEKAYQFISNLQKNSLKSVYSSQVLERYAAANHDQINTMSVQSFLALFKTQLFAITRNNYFDRQMQNTLIENLINITKDQKVGAIARNELQNYKKLFLSRKNQGNATTKAHYGNLLHKIELEEKS